LFGRIVRRDLHDTYGAGSPFVLPPRAAQDASDRMRAALDLGPRADPARLRGEPALVMASVWAEAVEAAFAPRPPPTFVNTDGDPLVRVLDRHAFDPARRQEVLEALAKVQCAELPGGKEALDMPAVVTITRPGNAQHSSWTNTIVAFVRVAEAHLEVETNSRLRAQGVGRTLAAALGTLVGPAKRREEGPEELLKQAARGSTRRDAPEKLDPERARLVRQLKERQYASWPDEPVPALGDRTPREVARNRRLRAYRELELILKDMEHSEGRSPPEERFDIRVLRRDLGMDE
jgi:hypothetical protein